MVQKFSPSAFHHGIVHGCLSARADLLIHESSIENKVLNSSMGGPSSGEKIVGQSLTARRSAERKRGSAQPSRSHKDERRYSWYTWTPFMHIDQQKCVACGNCVAICPMGAIS